MTCDSCNEELAEGTIVYVTGKCVITSSTDIAPVSANTVITCRNCLEGLD